LSTQRDLKIDESAKEVVVLTLFGLRAKLLKELPETIILFPHVPKAVAGSTHNYKFRLFYGYLGKVKRGKCEG